MVRLLLLLLLLLITHVPIFYKFYITANKVHKNGAAWGFLGLLAFDATLGVLTPIAWGLAGKLAEGTRIGHALLISFTLLALAAAVFVTVMVYKKCLIQGAAVEANEFAFCAECGTKCRASAAFCAKCGNSMKK